MIIEQIQAIKQQIAIIEQIIHIQTMHAVIHDIGRSKYRHSSIINGGQRQYVTISKHGNRGQIRVMSAIIGHTIQHTNMQINYYEKYN